MTLAEVDAIAALGKRVDHLQEWLREVSEKQRAQGELLERVRDTQLDMKKDLGSLTETVHIQNGLLARNNALLERLLDEKSRGTNSHAGGARENAGLPAPSGNPA